MSRNQLTQRYQHPTNFLMGIPRTTDGGTAATIDQSIARHVSVGVGGGGRNEPSPVTPQQQPLPP